MTAAGGLRGVVVGGPHSDLPAMLVGELPEHRLRPAPSVWGLAELLEDTQADFVVLDLRESEGLVGLAELTASHPTLAKLAVLDQRRLGLCGRALRLGADELCMAEDFGRFDLAAAVQRAIERADLRAGMQAAFDDGPVGLAILSGGQVVLANLTATLLGLRRGSASDWAESGPSEIRIADRSYELTRSPTRWRGGQGTLILLRDVSELKAARLQLRDREQRLVDLQRLDGLSRLAGGLAHRINNALATIGGHTTLLAEELGATGRGHLGPMRRAIDELADLTDSLVRLSDGQGREAGAIDVRAVLEGPTLASALPDRLRLVLDIDEVEAVQLPPGELRRGLMQLLKNAAEATEGTGEVVLRATTVLLDGARAQPLGLAPGRFLRLEVQDDGEGIRPEDLEHVLEPFFSGRQLGTGLGLTSVHGSVTRAGGALRLDSLRGHGTTVELFLPSQPLEGLPAESPLEVRGRVLVAEDDPKVRALLVRVLEAAGLEVTEAADGQQALRAFGAGTELIVTDVDMPHMTGPELVRAARGERPEVPVLFLSGYVDKQHELIEDARTAYLQKPFRLGLLRQTVARLLAGFTR